MNNDLVWERKVFSNGLRFLRFHRPHGLTCQLSIAIEYGSNDDSKDKIGLSHFLEHMIPGGSSSRIELNREIERIGGVTNFQTSPECTFCSADMFPGKLTEAAKIFSSLLFDNCFEKKKLEKERKIILNEIAEASDDPYNQINETFIKCLFKTHPVRHPIAGINKTIKLLTLSDIEKTHQNYYNPQNMILVLTGKFSKKDETEVLNYFIDRENNKKLVRKKIYNETGTPRKNKTLKKRGISQAYLNIGVKTVPANHEDIPKLELINTIIGVGTSSRLFREIREKTAVTYDIHSAQENGIDYGFFQIQCAIKKQNIDKTVALIKKEIEKIRTKKVQEQELNKAKDMISGNMYREIDSYASCAETLTFNEILFKKETALIDYLNKIRKVTTEDITKIANQYLKEDTSSIVMLIPKE